LYPRLSADMFEQQRMTLIEMIDAVEALVGRVGIL
jgi:hypothetical protein